MNARRREPLAPPSRGLPFAGAAPGLAIVSAGDPWRETTAPNRAES